MLSTARQTEETHESLRTVVSTIRGGMHQLRSLIDPKVECDQLWVHLAKQRLKGRTIDACEQYRHRFWTTLGFFPMKVSDHTS